MVQPGIETGKVATDSGVQPGALLIYRDNNTGGVFALKEAGDDPSDRTTLRDIGQRATETPSPARLFHASTRQPCRSLSQHNGLQPTH
jgi:hypothetical protein